MPARTDPVRREQQRQDWTRTIFFQPQSPFFSITFCYCAIAEIYLFWFFSSLVGLFRPEHLSHISHLQCQCHNSDNSEALCQISSMAPPIDEGGDETRRGQSFPQSFQFPVSSPPLFPPLAQSAQISHLASTFHLPHLQMPQDESAKQSRCQIIGFVFSQKMLVLRNTWTDFMAGYDT